MSRPAQPLSVGPSGRLSLMCLECEQTLRPFAGVKNVRLWLRAGCKESADEEPPVYLAVSTMYKYDYALGRTPDEVRCGDKVNAWRFVTEEDDNTSMDNCGRFVYVPMSAFKGCTLGRAARANALSIELGNSVVEDREICFDDVSVST